MVLAVLEVLSNSSTHQEGEDHMSESEQLAAVQRFRRYQEDCADIARVSRLADLMANSKIPTPEEIRELADRYRMVAGVVKEDIAE